MNIKYCSDYYAMSRLSSDFIVAELKKDRKQLLCAATGQSTKATYENLVQVYKNEPGLFDELVLAKLDEWVGMDPLGPGSCESYLQGIIVQPLAIPPSRFISFKGDAVSPQKECQRIQIEIQKKGPIDLCILGLGQNGHIGFNEPSESLTPHCHIIKLSEDSLNHQMIKGSDLKPTHGMTLGIADILQSKKILLLVSGGKKKKVIKELLSKEITPKVPASYLWQHKQVECYIDSSSL
jgi:galactosamine-6-phosphate isomerase